MPLDERVLRVVERARLLEHLVGDGELADVVQQPPGRELPQACGRKAELLPHLDGEERDSARVALGVFVLLREQPDEAPDLRAEERLLGGDELGAAQVARERPRRRRAEEVGRHGQADEQDARHLEPVPEPPGEIEIGQRQGRHERAGEPDEPDEDAESARRRVNSTVCSARSASRP